MEHLVAESDLPCPIAVVRPSLVGAVAGTPYPGFIGNLAGPSGMAVRAPRETGAAPVCDCAASACVL